MNDETKRHRTRAETTLTTLQDEARGRVKENWSKFILKTKLESNRPSSKFAELTGSILDEETLGRLGKELASGEHERFFKLMGKTKSPSSSDLKKYLFELKVMRLSTRGEVSPGSMSKIQNAKGEKLREYIERKPKEGAIIVENMTSQKLVEVLNTTSQEQLRVLLSNLSSQKSIPPKDGELEESLSEFFPEPKRSPFRESLKKVLMNSSPEKELSIYEGLLKMNETTLIRELSAIRIPSFLIARLSPKVLQECAQGEDPSALGAFIGALAYKERHVWLEKLAPRGTKLRELLDFELEAKEGGVPSDTTSKKIRIDFYSRIRSKLRVLSVEDECKDLTEEWLKKSP